MPCTDAQVEHYKTRGYVAGLRVLSDEQIGQLKERIEDILQLPPVPDGQDRGAVQGKGAAALRQGGQHLAPRPPLSAFFDNAAISALAHQLMPGPVPMWEDQMVYKLPTTRRRPWLGTDYTSWDHVGQLIWAHAGSPSTTPP